MSLYFSLSLFKCQRLILQYTLSVSIYRDVFKNILLLFCPRFKCFNRLLLYQSQVDANQRRRYRRCDRGKAKQSKSHRGQEGAPRSKTPHRLHIPPSLSTGSMQNTHSNPNPKDRHHHHHQNLVEFNLYKQDEELKGGGGRRSGAMFFLVSSYA